MMYGIDYLAGAQYQKLVLNNHPKGWAAGFFLETFGNAFPLIEKLAAKGTAPIIRVHSIWEDSHKYNKKKHDDKIINHFKKFSDIAKKYPKIKFYFSPFCEHTMTAGEMKAIVKQLKDIIYNKQLNNITIVNSIWTGQLIDVAGVINEIHSDHTKLKKREYIYSFDGLDAYNADTTNFKKVYKNCSIFFFWTISLNLKKKHDEKVSVQDRINRKYRPQKVHIDALIALAKDKGKTNVPDNFIIKPMSEDCEDLKSNKLLILSKKEYKQLKLIRQNNKLSLIEYLKKYPKTEDGLHRYYADKAGHEYTKKKNLTLHSDTEKIPISFNPSFRDGTFKNK